MTFMAWQNPFLMLGIVEKSNLKPTEEWAIALCDENGYFTKAINCPRDGQCDNDEIWYGDYIDCYGQEKESLRIASLTEAAECARRCGIPQLIGWRIADLAYDRAGIHVIYKKTWWPLRQLEYLKYWISEKKESRKYQWIDDKKPIKWPSYLGENENNEKLNQIFRNILLERKENPQW